MHGRISKLQGTESAARTAPASNTAAEKVSGAIYPNPVTQNSFAIRLSDPAITDVVVTLTDMSGKVVLKKSAKANTNFIISPSVPAGIYHVDVTSRNKKGDQYEVDDTVIVLNRRSPVQSKSCLPTGGQLLFLCCNAIMTDNKIVSDADGTAAITAVPSQSGASHVLTTQMFPLVLKQEEAQGWSGAR